MCGIVGYIGTQAAAPILVEGLKSLEYRGYDSAGIALAPGDGQFRVTRASGKLANLQARVDMGDTTPLGIGHTRWATHGRPTEENAHPHRSGDGQVVAVHNGIFENFLELRAELKAQGQTFAEEMLPVFVSVDGVVDLAHAPTLLRVPGEAYGVDGSRRTKMGMQKFIYLVRIIIGSLRIPMLIYQSYYCVVSY